MLVQKIQNNVCKTEQTSRRPRSLAKVASKSAPTFKANYQDVYNQCLHKNVTYSSVLEMGKDLFNAAVKENGLTKHSDFYNIFSSSYDSNFIINALRACKNRFYSEQDLLKSTSHRSPLITASDSSINFHHPEYGEFGAGNISFRLDEDRDIVFSRENSQGSFCKKTWSFYDNGQLKESYSYCESGIVDHHRYDRAGRDKSLFNRIFDKFFG